jgi:hypothetical protein
MTYISTHFTIDELTHSQEAARRGLDNDPPLHVLDALKNTAYQMELVRLELGEKPILISSGYRSPEVNAAVGGSKGSQHLLGQAVDFTCPTFGTPREIVQRLIDSAIQYDQVIEEFGKWVHISFSDRNRRQALIIDKTGTRAYA